MFAGFVSFGRLILDTLRDLAPIILVIAFFQIIVLEQPFPGLERVLIGLALVMVGLALFIRGPGQAYSREGRSSLRKKPSRKRRWGP